MDEDERRLQAFGEFLDAYEREHGPIADEEIEAVRAHDKATAVRVRGGRVVRPQAGSGTVPDVQDELQLTIVYEDGGDGWILARVLEVPAAIDQGRTRDEARANVPDALHAVFEMWPDQRPPNLEHETVTIPLAL